MKNTIISFLFFLSISYSFCINKPNKNQQKDSLDYYSALANNPKTNSSLTKAYLFFNIQKEESIRLKDTTSTINHLRQIAIIQNKLGDFYSSETTSVQALKLLENLKSNDFTTESKVGIFNQLGRIYMELLDYETSIKYYNQALKITTSRSSINIIKNNIALVYIEQLNYDLAEKEFLTIYQNSIPVGDLKQTARALDNLGYVQSKLSRPEALEKLFEALNIRIQIEDKTGQYSSYKYLSQHYLDKKDSLHASVYANKAYNIAKSINSTAFIEDALSNIISLNSNSTIFEYKKLKDSIEKAKQIAENKYALIKFNYLKQEKIADENKLMKEKEKRLKVIYQFIGALILLLALSLYFILRFRHKKEKVQQVYNTETRISKKVHDEVANDLYHIMTKLQSKKNTNEDVLDDLEGIYNKTRDISKENSTIDITENYNEVLNDLLLSYKKNDINVITQNISKIDWDTVSDLKKTTLYRVLQELMTNMRKHSQASIVLISFNQIKNKIVIDYKDNGVGCDLVKNNGLLNTENRMKSINGTITFESQVNNSFKAKITV